ncbi:MAG: methionine--tRNA ligase [Candidatus Nealsonbacteria bacterium]
MPNKKFYITTAIDYVNAAPHVGHAFEKIQADVIARYRRSLGDDVLFLSGADENGLKNVQAAEKEKISTKKLVDRNTKKFRSLKQILNLSYDDFIRTTEGRHIDGAQKLWKACQKDIYRKKYKGLYCIGCEQFYKENELINGLCPEHKTEPGLVEEDNYFFKLTKYQKKLKELIEKGKLEIVPQSRKNEVLSFIGSGLEDFCISRSAKRAKDWGINVPGDESQKIWVWFDALSNYINALDYAKNGKKFKSYWPADVHVIGKGILRFHAVYWPAMLISAGITLPKKIFVHGYITISGQKISKSLGNVIDPFELVDKYGTDPVRYFLLREISSTEDGDFTYEKFEARYNSDLAKGLGNLVSRVVTLAAGFSAKPSLVSVKLGLAIKKTGEKCDKALNEFKFNEALASIWELISFCDRYIEKEKPWETKDKKVINNLLKALGEIARLLKPFLPETSEKISEQLKNKKSKALFPRI